MKLRIEKAIYGGAGLARIDAADEGGATHAGKTAFVPLTLPGERVEAHVVEDKRGFVNAEVDSVLEPPLHARRASLPLLRKSCGGCSYQHADYATPA